MKKLLLLAVGSMLVLSCTKNAEQVEASKKKLADLGIEKAILDKHKFTVNEVFDKDVYKKIENKLQRNADELKELGEYEASTKKLNEISKYLDLRDKATNKTFYIVDAYRVEGDTLNKSQLYLDDKNNVLDFIIYK